VSGGGWERKKTSTFGKWLHSKKRCVHFAQGGRM
jgi:hypothetical protein